ncbi:hypothetical protein KEU06_08750 [Pseudaminobacter sp. 19-2017]|uniref:Uncharacterized protein n=1 Tax=Pseudaminobacter soli (ex Zhang et al. 2022) TaxID=2831468 RepID=A0A942E0E8_9HYPH|nr:hypothetical protein [Pseudaminobacter soli]MBS3648716.1 hypothetical protein [Pseudaminobacter soli]
MNREEIAAYYGVSLARVKRWIAELGVPASHKTKGTNTAPRPVMRPRVADDDGLTLIEKARLILGKRMSRDYRGYLLDGRVVRVDVLVRAAGLQVPDVP